MMTLLIAAIITLLVGSVMVRLWLKKGREPAKKNKTSGAGAVISHSKKVGSRGISGAGGGKPAYVPVPLLWRATTTQICGLYPFRNPGPPPMVGAPIGRHVESKATVCFDHINWFLAKLIGNPSMLVLGKPGTGKSTLVSRILINVAAGGYRILIPGDTKPDYTSLTKKLGGEVRTVLRKGGDPVINPCDPGGMAHVGQQIGGIEGDALIAEAIGRATVCLATLLEISRGSRVADYEESTITVALRLLYDKMLTGSPEPLIADVNALIGQMPTELTEILLTSTVDEYKRLTGPLQRSFNALLNGQYGDIFSRRVHRDTARPAAVNIDTSAIKSGDQRFLGAVLVSAWSETYGQIEADQALAAAGLAPKPLYCLVIDELWRVLKLGKTMGDRVDELTRLNRSQGVGQIMITHSIRELSSGRSGEVEGIEERAGVIVVGAVPQGELEALAKVVTFTKSEERMIRSWWSMSQAGQWGGGDGFETGGQRYIPPGAGKFLFKPSADDPGIPVDVVLSSVENEWGGQDTNALWVERIGSVSS